MHTICEDSTQHSGRTRAFLKSRLPPYFETRLAKADEREGVPPYPPFLTFVNRKRQDRFVCSFAILFVTLYAK